MHGTATSVTVVAGSRGNSRLARFFSGRGKVAQREARGSGGTTSMKRSLIAQAAAVSAVLAVAGCSGHSTGITAQSGPAPTPTSATRGTAVPASPSEPTTATSSASATLVPTSPAVTETPTTTRPPTQPVPVPSVSGAAAQAAVDAYFKLDALDDAGQRDPAHADLKAINALLAPSIRTQWDSIYLQMAKQDLAARGAPPNARLKVVSVSKFGAVFASCPLYSKTDPYVEYHVATGKVVPQQKRAIPPPYERSIFMTDAGGVWRMSAYVVDGSRTCTKS